MHDWWAPKTAGGPSVVLPLPLPEVPAVLRRAIDAVPGAAAMEIRADGAVIGRRTSFAVRAENIVMAFEPIDATSSRVRIIREGRDGLDYGRVLVVSPMARAILCEARAAATPPPPS
ncbi:hypothetical protein DEJ13_08230 [Curtobacterium sp. MCLR17_007]|uniref:hypothetical protein n=1 Tax=Curtobacterium sp. MCLR17_007 TaxID=2175648 RepID=UPI000DA6ED4E|nr:hypothetical protein [Curtobacterium sp. MCLR17_007]WIB61805.1 hypothetical protein DEJ13_08230 [Curtobacterium sp. MCLR17_007]